MNSTFTMATYVCLSTSYICVSLNSPHMCACPFPTYGCLSTCYTYVCMYQVRNWHSNVIWFDSFLCWMILMWDVIVEICGIVYHHCLHFFIRVMHHYFMTLRILKYSITFNLIIEWFINSCFCIFYTDLTIWILHLHPPHMCVCPKSGPGFIISYGLVLFCVQWYWCEMSSLIFVELFTITVYISLSESRIINW
jgi:hypothetical protein